MGKASPIPNELQQMRILEYDTNQYPFREALAEILGVKEEDLERLHCTEQGRAALEGGKTSA